MKLLAVDTASVHCAACVLDGGALTARVSLALERGHAERLMDVIAEALDQAGIGYADIDRLAVSVGPGSFMGVRTGVAAIRGLALALGCPAVGVTTLDAMAAEARAAHPGKPVVVAVDARRDEIYAAAFDAAGEVQLAPSAVRLAELAALVGPDSAIAGSAAAALVAALGRSHPIVLADAATADIVWFADLAARAAEPAGRPAPLYLRAPDARPQTGFALPRQGAVR